jgi:Tol biopolymer transport system component
VPLSLEALEDRVLLTAVPLSLADPTLYGVTGLGASTQPSISADGQLIAFESRADNLVPNDSNGHPDAFVYSRATGAVTLVSVGANGQAAGTGNQWGDPAPAISPDGRYVAFVNNEGGVLPGISGNQLYLVFTSDSDNLVAGMSPPAGGPESNLYEYDLTTGTTSLVSTDGTAISDFYGGGVSVSADGRFIAYQSKITTTQANNPSSSNTKNIVVRDRDTGAITLVSVNTAGTGGGNHDSVLLDSFSARPGDTQSISADGRYVVFESQATNLGSQPVSGSNVYLRDLLSGTTTLVNAAANGTGPGGASGAIISPDGHYIAFVSNNSLLSQDTTGHNEVYLYNVQTGTLSLASINAAATSGGNADSGGIQNGGLAFSADSQSLAFPSLATDLTSGVATSQANLFVRNLAAGTTTLVSADAGGSDGGDQSSSYTPALSADGKTIAFTSAADNLVSGDLNRQTDIFVRDLKATTTPVA